LSFHGEEKFDERHRVLLVLRRSRHGGRIADRVAEINAGREADDVQVVPGRDRRRVIDYAGVGLPSDGGSYPAPSWASTDPPSRRR
jgi:hypothetical protein